MTTVEEAREVFTQKYATVFLRATRGGANRFKPDETLDLLFSINFVQDPDAGLPEFTDPTTVTYSDTAVRDLIAESLRIRYSAQEQVYEASLNFDVIHRYRDMWLENLPETVAPLTHPIPDMDEVFATGALTLPEGMNDYTAWRWTCAVTDHLDAYPTRENADLTVNKLLLQLNEAGHYDAAIAGMRRAAKSFNSTGAWLSPESVRAYRILLDASGAGIGSTLKEEGFVSISIPAEDPLQVSAT